MWEATTLMGKKEERQRTSGGAGGCWGSELQWKQRLVFCSCYPKPALHSSVFLVLPPRAVQWKVSNFPGPGLFSYFHGSDKNLVRRSLFSQHPLRAHVQHMQTHTNTKAFSLFPALCYQFHHCFSSVCFLTCIQCSIPACAVLPTATDVHVFPYGLCTHQIFTIPLWHLAQVQMSWIRKRWLFPPLITTCRSSLGWWLSSISHPLFMFCFVNLLAQQIINQS